MGLRQIGAVPLYGEILADAQRDILFTQFMKEWLAMMRGSVEIPTYSTYARIINNEIVPYFDKNYPGLKLNAIMPKHIQDYYSYLMNDRNLTANTAIHN